MPTPCTFGRYLAGTGFATVGIPSLDLESDLLDLSGILACWPTRSFHSLDFLLDTVPFSFDDPAVNYRRVVLYRGLT